MKDKQKQKNILIEDFFTGLILMQRVLIFSSEIQNYITQSNEEKLKGNFAEELLNYILSIFKPLKHIRYFAEKILPTL